MDRRRGHFVKRAVHPVADLEVLFEGLEMDVGGLLLDRLIENEIDVTDDGRGVRLGFQICGAHAGGGGVKLAEDILHRLAFAAVAIVDLGLHQVIRRDDDVDFAAEGESQVFGRLRVQRIDQRDVESGLVEANGQRAVQAGRAGGHEREERLGRGPVAEIDHAGAQLGGHDRPDIVAILDDLEICQNLGDFFAAMADFREDILGERLVDETARLKKFDDLLVVHGTGMRKGF